MGRFLQGMKTAPKSTSILVWVFGLLVLATFALWLHAVSAGGRDRSALWTSVDEATRRPGAGEDALQNISSENSGTLAGRAARFQLARWHLQGGLQFAVGNPTQASASFKKARTLYSELIPDCVDTPLLTQEAMMGKATAEESLAGLAGPPHAEKPLGTEDSEPAEEENYLAKALQDYRALASMYPDSILGKQAAKRANELESSRSQIEQFYAEASNTGAPKLNMPVKSK
jgi:hypothetical protein